MNIDALTGDDAVLTELGGRLAQRRLALRFTQAGLAEQAGVSKRTVERIESGKSTQTATLVRILRVLELLGSLDSLIPAAGPRPMDLLKLKGKQRRRASSRRSRPQSGKEWSWDDGP